MTNLENDGIVVSGLHQAEVDPDANLRRAAADGGPVRMRLQPAVLAGKYLSLPGVRWILDLPGEAGAKRFLRELDEWIGRWR